MLLYLLVSVIPFGTKPLLILLMLAFFWQKQHFWGKTVPVPKAIVWELCYRFFSSAFSFSKRKDYFFENVIFTDYASGNRLPDCSKLTINRENDNDVTVCQHDDITGFFDFVLFLMSNLVTGASFMSIRVLPNILRLGRDWDIKFGRNVSNEMLLNVVKYQNYSFYRFWVIKVNKVKPIFKRNS